MGFEQIEVLERHPFKLDDASRYPLFTPDLIHLMQKLLSPERQAEVATAITVTATRPG